MAEELRKGSIGNPYNLQEAQELFDKGLWQGGFVRIEPDIIKYFRSSERPFDDTSAPDADDGCLEWG